MIFNIPSLSEIDQTALDFIGHAGANKHFAFYGAMGVGKTTFIKALCKALGVRATVTSPTFALVNEYPAGKRGMIYHFDFYRINKPEELFDFGCEEYFDSGNYCLVEWPEKGEIVLPGDIKKVYIQEMEDGSRQITIDF